jgi:predicted ATPase
MENPNFYIISGAPGAGKTTLLTALSKHGFKHVEEAGRQIIQEQTRLGGNGTHLGDQVLFRELMLSRMIEHYTEVVGSETPVFFDRGIPGLLGYSKLIGADTPLHLLKAVDLYRYNPIVFLAPPWPGIYREDQERKQSLDEAFRTYELLCDAYLENGYRIIELPQVSVEDRAALVLSQISKPGR